MPCSAPIQQTASRFDQDASDVRRLLQVDAFIDRMGVAHITRPEHDGGRLSFAYPQGHVATVGNPDRWWVCARSGRGQPR